MLALPWSGMSQPPEGNSNSLLTETLIASCMREICMSRAPTSVPICCCSCWYCASSSAFLCCDSSYVDCDTQPAISIAAANANSVENFVIEILHRQELKNVGNSPC